MKNILLVIGKQPLIGFSKTRLAAQVGHESSLEIYQGMIEDFAINYANYREKLPMVLAITPDTEESRRYFSKMFSDIKLMIQPELPFFKRIQLLIQKLHETGPCYIHLTGTDLPHFPFHQLNTESTSTDTVVLGPDRDGGFYYAGFYSGHANLFEIETKEGGSNIFDLIKSRALNIGLGVVSLAECSDIDTLEDLQHSLEKYPGLLANTLKAAKKIRQ